MGLYQNIREDANSNVYVNLQDGSGNSINSTSNALDVFITNALMIGEPDESAFTYGSSDFQPIGGVFSSSITALTSGQAGVVQLTAMRSMYTTLFNSSGVAMGDSNAHSIFVRPGDGTNSQAYSATSEAFVAIREGGNVANVNASNQLLTADANSGSILALMSPATSTLTQIALAVTTGVALALNAARKGMAFFNDSSFPIYLAFHATATTSAYTVKMQAQSYYEQFGDRVYTGIVAVISTNASGNLVVTELS